MDTLKQIRLAGLEMYDGIYFYTNKEYLNIRNIFQIWKNRQNERHSRIRNMFFLSMKDITGLFSPLFSVFASSESKRQGLKLQKGKIQRRIQKLFLHQFNATESEAMYKSASESWRVGSNPQPQTSALLTRILNSHCPRTKTERRRL